jgi:hypothetical protein
MRTACGIFNLDSGVLPLCYGFWVTAVPLAGVALIPDGEEEDRGVRKTGNSNSQPERT